MKLINFDTRKKMEDLWNVRMIFREVFFWSWEEYNSFKILLDQVLRKLLLCKIKF